MKKTLMIVLTLSVLLLMSVTASAQHDWHNDQHYDNDNNWHHTHHGDNDSERGMPFGWHDRFDTMRDHHRLERVEGREWDHRFPGLRAYHWRGEGFYHHGHYVSDAILFYDRDNELVSVGYMHDGVFVFFREDHESYENHDSFFISWWKRW
ncbi:MAG: hypothetical protein P4N41_24580 [Negativicutes bacterium]|nr:hypothetical protein [Negativicutes bacterium]MDR3592848.1 hypothetical protein [Negativicutes bacterium]